MYNGTVVKAKFYFFKKTKEGDKIIESLDGKPHSVLMNPSSIDYDFSRRIKSNKSTADGGKKDTAKSGGSTNQSKDGVGNVGSDDKVGGISDDSISMDLIFDLVDEYDLVNNSIAGQIGTLAIGIKNAVQGTGQFKGELDDDNLKTLRNTKAYEIDVTNEKFCILKRLINTADNGGKIAFSWGSILAIGTIESINTRFTYFSRFGNPLRAEVSLTIQAHHDQKQTDEVQQQVDKDKALEEVGAPAINATVPDVDVPVSTSLSAGGGPTINYLAEQNEDFDNPVVEIKVNDEDKAINGEGSSLLVEKLSVSLTSGMESSLCTFTLFGKQNAIGKDGKFNIDKNLLKLKLGAKVEIFMGYKVNNQPKVEKVFSGFIITQNISYSGETDLTCSVEAMDVKFLMMNSRRSEIKKDMTKYSDVVSDILMKYASYSSGSTIEETPEKEHSIVQFNQSDYEFIVSAAKKYNYLFYVKNGEIQFISYGKISTKPVLKILPGKYLHLFSRDATLVNQVKKVVVRNNDQADPTTPIEGSATSANITLGDGDKSGADLTNTVGEANEILIIDKTVTSPQEAEERAKAEFDKLSMYFVTGEIEISGVPLIQPGDYIAMDNLHEGINGAYFVKEVEHKMKGKDYITICKIGANKLNAK